MAKSKRVVGPQGAGRGSPEAVAKRKVARKLNGLLTGRAGANGPTLDGRTERRRQRLLHELKEATGKGGKGFLPIDLLRRVHELLELGEPLSSIRKVTHVRPNRALNVEQATDVLREVHAAYNFQPRAYLFLGLPREALTAARIVPSPRRGRPPK